MPLSSPLEATSERNDLLAAVATAGFQRLQKQKLEGKVARSSVADALAIGAADYVAFILANPNLYRLMKGPEFADREAYPALHAAAAAPAETLLSLVATLLDDNRLKTPTVEQGATTL